MRELLSSAQRPVLVAGADLLGAVGLQRLGAMAQGLGNEERPCPIYPVLGGPNSFGAALLSLPEQDDMLTRLESGKVRMLVCLESDPLLEAPAAERFSAALTQLEILVSLDYLPTPLSKVANLFIPTRSPVECDGTFINNEGRVRMFSQVLEPGIPIRETGQGGHPPREFSTFTPGGEPVAAVSLLQDLLNDGSSLNELREQIAKKFHRLADLGKVSSAESGFRVAPAPDRDLGRQALPEQPLGTMQLIVSPARYGSDLFSRFSDKLDSRKKTVGVSLHPDDARERGFNEGEMLTIDTDCGSFSLPLNCHPGLAAGCVLLENSDSFAPLVPGRGLAYCQVHREVADE